MVKNWGGEMESPPNAFGLNADTYWFLDLSYVLKHYIILYRINEVITLEIDNKLKRADGIAKQWMYVKEGMMTYEI